MADSPPAGLDCPVCFRPSIPVDAEECPNCRSDLGPLRRVMELAASYTEDAERELRSDRVEQAERSVACALGLGDSTSRTLLLAGNASWASGRARTAQDFWRRARSDDATGEAERRLEMARGVERRRRARRMFGVLALVLLCAASVVLAVSWLGARQDRAHLEAELAEVRAVRPLESSSPGAAARPPAEPASPPQVSEARPDPFAALAAELALVPGVLVFHEAGEPLRATFAEAAFESGGSELRMAVLPLLEEISTRAAESGVGFRLLVEGFTDADVVGEGWFDNWTLGLARAQEAARRLRMLGRLDLSTLLIASRAGGVPPSASGLGEPQCRTIVLTFLEPSRADAPSALQGDRPRASGSGSEGTQGGVRSDVVLP